MSTAIGGPPLSKTMLSNQALEMGDSGTGKLPHSQCGEDCQDRMLEVTEIFQAVKSGMLIPVQTMMEHFGPEMFALRDEKGHTAVHWICLGGHTTLLRYIIENKAPVNLASNNDLGARPVHWACVNGHIAIVEILLMAGVSLDVCDNKGCTPLIVAAQYGQTMLAGYLMGKGARLQMVDKDGDNALHWAAFKGCDGGDLRLVGERHTIEPDPDDMTSQSELMRLLIYSGFNALQRDNYGQTPLHLACISGNITSVKELCELDSADINLVDKNGKTPLMLATGRKHNDVVIYLKREIKLKTSILPRIDFWSIVFGPPGKSKGPILFFVLNLLCWAYPMYIFKCLPLTFTDLQYLHIVFFMTNILMWLCLYHANTTDPGFLPRNVPQYDQAIKQVAHYDEWKKGVNPLSRLCHTCRTVKPVRSKHCRVCNRCVKMFDHHCPYIYNCVGHDNRTWFLGFVCAVSFNCLASLYFSLVLLRLTGLDWAVVLGFLQLSFFGAIATGISVFAVSHALNNLTTNERLNHRRYTYLQDIKGNFHNPFNRGWKINVQEFFHLRQPLGDQEAGYIKVV